MGCGSTKEELCTLSSIQGESPEGGGGMQVKVEVREGIGWVVGEVVKVRKEVVYVRIHEGDAVRIKKYPAHAVERVPLVVSNAPPPNLRSSMKRRSSASCSAHTVCGRSTKHLSFSMGHSSRVSHVTASSEEEMDADTTSYGYNITEDPCLVSENTTEHTAQSSFGLSLISARTGSVDETLRSASVSSASASASASVSHPKVVFPLPLHPPRRLLSVER